MKYAKEYVNKSYWIRLSDPYGDYSMEQRILVFCNLAATIGSSLFACFEIFNANCPYQITFKVSIALSFFLAFFLSRNRRKFYLPFFIQGFNNTIFTINAWLNDGGLEGIAPLMFVISIVVYAQLLKSIYFPYVAIFFCFLLLALTLYSLNFQIEDFFKLDIILQQRFAFTMIIMPLVGGIVSTFRSTIEIYRKKISKQNQGLKKSQKKYKELIESIKDNFFLATLDHEQNLTYVSPSIENILGYQKDELSSLKDILLNGKSLEDLFLEKEIEVRAADESIHYMTIAVNKKIEDGILKGYECVVQDITARIRHEQSYQKTIQEHEELIKLKSKFLSMVSHQFRTPLAVIHSSIDLIEFHIKKHAESALNINRHTLQIHQALEQLTNLMENLLTKDKIEAKTIHFSPSVICFNLLVKKIITQYDLLLTDEQKIELEIRGESKTMWMDGKLAENIVSNLFSNAVKYSKGKKSPKAIIQYQETSMIFQVQDFGIGIAKEDIPNLFQPFFRAKNTENFKGTGVGLSVVKEFVDLHEGKIEVDSEQGVQTTFTITFPYLKEK
ncbi:sensor histidine kinase [Sediminitomix flava]|uniref:histidine kinase n=1 Tax=Sediminitomix flava TaxID=379075 RepID=A0A315YW44_SEDFL|nr:PAS domain-containing sensor histidine kinase [Sediminitomix flava]PWJ34125.1 PAS domain S-box-containing protein [Sediminitomix flava]